MPDAEYHARRSHLGSTSVKMLAKHPPAVYRWQVDNPQPHKAAYDLGRVAHSLILEGHERGLSVVDADDWRTKAAREARDAAYNDGMTPLLRKDYQAVRNMADAVLTHPAAAELLTGHVAERSYFTELHGVPVKARPDALNGTTVVDLKTTGADLGDVARTIHSFGYHIQQAHYTDVMRASGQTIEDFVFVFVSKQPPHMVRVIRLEEPAVDLGREQTVDALATYKACTETGNWPGYDLIDTVDLPRWVYSQADDELEIVIT